MDVEHEIGILVDAIKENGDASEGGTFTITFGKVYDATVDTLEALNGTLRAAKKRKIVSFEKQMLLKGADDAAIVTLLPQEA
mgnify:CR=1 FL=1|jgi:hypothetical protein